MKVATLAAALAATVALAAPMAPAWASIETEEAKSAAVDAAQTARDQMAETFGETSLEPGRFVWKRGAEQRQVTQVVVSLSDQLVYTYAGDELIAVSTISSGTDDHPTPTGIFDVLDKKPLHRSVKYDNAPMPWMMRLDDFGIALHAGHNPGYPASHGCIRLPDKFAAKLYGKVDLGTQVMIAS